MLPSNLSETTGEEHTTTRRCGYYEDAEGIKNLAEEFDDATTLAEELDDVTTDQRDARIALLQQLCGEYLEQLDTYKHTERIRDTLDQAAVGTQRLHEQISVLTEDRDRQSARQKELSAALSKEQADSRDLVTKLANKGEMIRELYQQADATTRLTATAEGILHSEIQALNETVVQQTIHISEEIDRQGLGLQELSTALVLARFGSVRVQGTFA
ncbi:hypothetical protein B0H16DRAFT_1788074 [Mycena metata]|uniref:Uncharacterized protein n=1 Tax=Mycena metata TaxID=1033252 RepID=A0AAD7HLE1_9AGAR|nr:hypothetical protein B0H16DRAFT_1788074 [Mycena metata]